MAGTDKSKKTPFCKEDLIVLQHAKGGNPVSVQIVELKDALDGLSIDLEGGTWTRTHRKHFTSAEIGQARPIADDGFIGVFDRTRIEHLRNMVWAHTEACRKEDSFLTYAS